MKILSKFVILFLLTILSSLTFSNLQAKSSNWSLSETSKLRLISPFSQNNNNNILIGLEYQMDPGWKTYWKSPGDGGFPQIISWDESRNVKNLKILWPTPIEFEILGFKSLGYKDHVIFPIEVEVENKNLPILIDLKIRYLICEEICIPGEADLFLEIPSGSQTNSEFYFSLEKALSILPENNIDSSYIEEVETKVFKSNDQTTIRIEVSSSKSFYNPKFFLHTPFGLPIVTSNLIYSFDNKKVISDFTYDENLIAENNFPLEIIIKDSNNNFIIKNNVKINDKLQKNLITKQLLYLIIISFVGGLILNIMPCVFPILSIKLMSVLSTDTKNARLSFLTSAIGIITSFLLLGVFFIILQNMNVSIAWGMQFQQPYFLIFITSVIFLFMMNMFNQFEINLPNTFLNRIYYISALNLRFKDFFNGFFATLLATPCSAPFIGTAITAAFTQKSSTAILIFLFMGIGMSLPYLVISIFPKLIKFVPKSGRWMIYIKYFLGFLLFLTIIWLSNILLNFFNYYFLLLALATLLLVSYRKKITIFKNTISIAAILSLFILSDNNFFKQNVLKVRDDNWLNFLDVSIDELVKNNEIIFLDITADWCATCQFNKVNVLHSKKIIKIFNTNKIKLIRADWTKPNDKINNFLEKYDRFGIPFNAFFSKDYPDGILLSELLFEKEIIEVLKKINNE